METTTGRVTPLQCIGERYLIYQTRSYGPNSDLWLMPLRGERKPVPLIQTKFNEEQAQVSPDGRWLAYTSDESGETQVYVRTFVSSGQVGSNRYQVSLSAASTLVGVVMDVSCTSFRRAPAFMGASLIQGLAGSGAT